VAQHPVGGEFQVNAYTTGNQSFSAIAPDGTGGFVAAWDSTGSSGTDTSDRSVQGRLFDADGSPVGDEFQVNTYTTGRQTGAAVGPSGAGGFVVAWASDGSGGTDSDWFSIQAQRYDADGSPAGEQFQVNTYTTDAQVAPAIAQDGVGGFVVVWQSEGSSGTDTSGWSVQGQRYTANGSPLGGEFQVNSYTPSPQYFPAVGPDGTGGFVVTWSSGLSSGDDELFSIWARRYGANGLPAGDEFQVNTHTTSSQFFSDVASDGGEGFVIAWQSQLGPGTNSFGIRAQRYAANGSPAGGEFAVNTYSTGNQTDPAVAPDGAGGFVIAWTSDGSYGTDTDWQSVQAQRYAADGTPIGGELQVNTYTTWWQEFPALAPVGEAGGFVVAWHSYGSSGSDSEAQSIQAQRYVLTEIFADGFESGDTSAWSTVVP
jgi:hypothetical protein